MQPTARDKGNEPIAPDDVDTSVDNELSSSSSLSLSLSPTKNARESKKTRSHKRPLSHHAVSSASRRARREAGKRKNRPYQASRNQPVFPSGTLPPMSHVHPTFGAAPTFYIPPPALIRRPNDMLSSPLGQHILDYDPPHGFVIPIFTTFDGSTDPFDRMLHYNQAMTLNADND